MSACRDNSRLGRIGCGATYFGEMQHSVAKVSWSRHPDGQAHVTARLSTIDALWRKGRGEMADPAMHGYEQDGRGVWRTPQTPENAARLDRLRADSGCHPISVTASDATGGEP